MSTANKKSSKAAKKTPSKKSKAKKSKAKKTGTKKTGTKKTSLKKSKPGPVTSASPLSSDCKCKQKKPKGKFFCFRLEQGRWVQSSFIPFPTKEACEEAMCEE